MDYCWYHQEVAASVVDAAGSAAVVGVVAAAVGNSLLAAACWNRPQIPVVGSGSSLHSLDAENAAGFRGDSVLGTLRVSVAAEGIQLEQHDVVGDTRTAAAAVRVGDIAAAAATPVLGTQLAAAARQQGPSVLPLDAEAVPALPPPCTPEVRGPPAPGTPGVGTLVAAA